MCGPVRLRGRAAGPRRPRRAVGPAVRAARAFCTPHHLGHYFRVIVSLNATVSLGDKSINPCGVKPAAVVTSGTSREDYRDRTTSAAAWGVERSTGGCPYGVGSVRAEVPSAPAPPPAQPAVTAPAGACILWWEWRTYDADHSCLTCASPCKGVLYMALPARTSPTQTRSPLLPGEDPFLAAQEGAQRSLLPTMPAPAMSPTRSRPLPDPTRSSHQPRAPTAGAGSQCCRSFVPAVLPPCGPAVVVNVVARWLQVAGARKQPPSGRREFVSGRAGRGAEVSRSPFRRRSGRTGGEPSRTGAVGAAGCTALLHTGLCEGVLRRPAGRPDSVRAKRASASRADNESTQPRLLHGPREPGGRSRRAGSGCALGAVEKRGHGGVVRNWRGGAENLPMAKSTPLLLRRLRDIS